MTWIWLTCFSCLAALGLQASVVAGRVHLENARKPSDCSGVVISLTPLGARPPAPSDAAPVARMVQKNKTFIPHVLAIEVGTQVEFPNLDPIFHNAFSNYDGQVFDLGLYPPGKSRRVTFDRPGVVRIFCNIHSAMSALLVVLPTPWFATTGSSGAFEIRGVPPGEYLLRVFDERAAPATLQALERRVTVQSDARADLGAIGISESGYLPIPHQNKYGHDYGPEPDDQLYPRAGK